MAAVAVEAGVAAEAELQDAHRHGGGAGDGQAGSRRGEVRARAGRHDEPRFGRARQARAPSSEARVEQQGGAAAALCGEEQAA